MHSRLIRSSILVLLLAVASVTAYILWDSHRQSIAAADRSRALNAALDGLVADVAELGAAQQAYVVPAQSDGPWIARVSALLQRLYDQAAALQGAGPAADTAAQAMRESLDALVAIDSHAREYLRMHQDLMASDLVFNEAREALASIAASARNLRVADAAANEEALRRRDVLQASALGATAGLWLLGVLLLMRRPGAGPAAPTVETPAPLDTPAAEHQASAAPPVGQSIDWPRAASVCVGLARLTDGATLPAVFRSIGQALDSPGAILWLGAGEQLFAAAAHGYEERILSRLGPIDRNAENATAAAWRTATLQTVAGDAVANGAIVAPLVGTGSCRGVLAVEVRAGRETDPAVQSVISMIAAQLGGLVAAWPAASAREEKLVVGR